MLLAKQELLAALTAELERLLPGAGAKASFESPKVAAHGDLACTAAMHLAKPLGQNPRQVGEALRSALMATPAFMQWVWVMVCPLLSPDWLRRHIIPNMRPGLSEVLQTFGSEAPATHV